MPRPRRSRRNAIFGSQALNSRPPSAVAGSPAAGMKERDLWRRTRPTPVGPEKEDNMISRRGFLGTAAALAGGSAVSGRVQAASIPEAPTTKATTMQPPVFPTSGPNYQQAVTFNGTT